MAECLDDPNVVLVGEAKLECTAGEIERELAALGRKAARCPALAGREILSTLWLVEAGGKATSIGARS